MLTQEKAIENAGSVLARSRAEQAERTPRQAAEVAHVPGGPSVEELESRIRARRGMPARTPDAEVA